MRSDFDAGCRGILLCGWFVLLLGFWSRVSAAGEAATAAVEGATTVAHAEPLPTPTTATAPNPAPLAPPIAAPPATATAPNPAPPIAPPIAAPPATVPAPPPTTILVDAGDPSAELFLDGSPVGRGSWRGSLPFGRHRLELVREGYESQQFDLDSERGDSVALVPVWKPARNAQSRGVFVRLGLSGLMGPKADQISMNCPSATGCNSRGPWGAGGDLRIGYSLKRWLAPEFTALGYIDATNISTSYDAASTYGASRFYGPSRTENYTFLRYGWMLGLGGRVRTPTSPFQGTLGVAFGVAATTAQFTKIGVTTGNTSPNPTEALLPGEQHRTSSSQTLYNPALLLDAAAMLAVGDGFRVYLGALLLATFSDRPIRLAGENSTLGSSPATGAGTPYGMPNVTASRKTSIYFGPTLGFHFGN